MESHRTVRRWFPKFPRGDKSFEDEEGKEGPSILDNKELRAIIEENPRQCVREISGTWC